MSLSRKLVVGFGAILVLTFVLAVAALTSMSVMRAEIGRVADQHAVRVDLAGQISTGAAQMLRLENGIILRLILQDQTRSEAYKQAFQTTSAKVQSLIRQMEQIPGGDDDKARLESIRGGVERWIGMHREMLAMLDAQQFDGAQKMIGDQITPAGENLERACATMSDGVRTALKESSTAAQSRQAANFWVLLLLGIVAALVGAGLLWMVRRSTGELRKLIMKISEGVGLVASAAQQVSTSSQTLAQGATGQAASLSETAATSQEITAMTRRNLDSTESVTHLMGDAEANVSRMTEAFDRMSASMREISGSSEKIARIIKVIDEIAFQTNILALNAAVEAARAGEAGMGFAVVADEVRNLAQRSAQAAKDTAELIEESILKSHEGATKLAEVAQAITTSNGISSKVKTLADQVNVASKEQARGIEQISQAIAGMEQVTQQTVSAAEQSASAGEEMSSQAQEMKAAVEELVIVVGGGV
ncbi:MAG TPA: methyl-accepting chemotaxis protein [Bryobacteraceae bacterium]|nr:methyl-accepting chemotaxis protein [Bryobacteraceae bacterium]